MKKLYTVFFALLCFSFSKAQFSGSYAPASWSTVLSAGSNGSVNTAGAPTSITVTGSNDASNTMSPSPVNTDFTITVASSGTFGFSWTYTSNDIDANPSYDVAGVLINGSFTQLTNDGGTVNQSGTYTSPFVSAGTVIGFRMSAIDNAYGNATFTISSFSKPGGTLPVQLIAFTGKQQNEKVALQWTTSAEVNASHFNLERSANGHDFSVIDNVAAQNTNGFKNYSSVDASPFKGMNYYRLRMIDLDGSSRFSDIVSVKLNAKTNSFSLYPNPAKNELTIRISAESQGRESIYLFDAAGQMIKKESCDLVPGINMIRINIDAFAEGIYFIKEGAENEGVRFIKK